MADRVHPSSKQQNVATTAANPAAGPAAKSQLYNPTRPPYRPNPRRHRPRSRRSCLCQCCIWCTIVLLLVLLLASVAGAAVYLIYHPHRPAFSIATFRISRLKLTSTPEAAASHLAASFSLAIAAHNPNSKVTFSYDPFAISVLSHDVLLGNASFTSFDHLTKNTTLIRAAISSSQDLDTDSFTVLKSDLKKKNSLPLEIQLDTKVTAKMGGLKSNKVGIRVSCRGIEGIAPKGKSPSVASTSDAKCEVDLRIKIWKFTF